MQNDKFSIRYCGSHDKVALGISHIGRLIFCHNFPIVQTLGRIYITSSTQDLPEPMEDVTNFPNIS